MLPQSIINRMVEGTTEAMDNLLFRIIMGCTFVLENVFTANEHKAAIATKARRRVGERNLVCDCQVRNVGYRRENQVRKKCTNYPVEDNRCRNRDDWIECDVNCDPDCFNRPFVANQMMRERFRIHYYTGRGLGLKTLVSIERGSFVMEYAGLVRYVEDEEEDTMAAELNYAYRIRGTQYVVDAKHMGNQARFINHSCNPNLQAYSYVTQGTIKIVLEAIKNIPAGQELTLNYFDVIEGYRCRCGWDLCEYISPDKKANEDIEYQQFRKQEKIDRRNKRLFGSDGTNSCTPVARRTRSKQTEHPPTSCADQEAASGRRRELSADPCQCLSSPNPPKCSKKVKKSRCQTMAQELLRRARRSLSQRRQSIESDSVDSMNQQRLNHDDEVPSTSAACRQELEASQRQANNNNNDDGQLPSTSAACRRELAATQQQQQQQYRQPLPVDPSAIKRELGARSKGFIKSKTQPDHINAQSVLDWQNRLSQSPELGGLDEFIDDGGFDQRQSPEGPVVFIDIASSPSPDRSLPASPNARSCVPPSPHQNRQRTPEVSPNLDALVPYGNVSFELDMDLVDRPDLSPNAIFRNILAPTTPNRRMIRHEEEPPTNNNIVCPGHGDYGPIVPCLDEPQHLCRPGRPNYRNGTLPCTPGRTSPELPWTPPPRRSTGTPPTPQRGNSEPPLTPGASLPPTPGRRSNERPWTPLINLVRGLITPEGQSTRPPTTPGRDISFLPPTPCRRRGTESPWTPIRRLALTYTNPEREGSGPPRTPGRGNSLPPVTPGRGSDERPWTPVRAIAAIDITQERQGSGPPCTPGRRGSLPPGTPGRGSDERPWTPVRAIAAIDITPERQGSGPPRTPGRGNSLPPVTPGRGSDERPWTPVRRIENRTSTPNGDAITGIPQTPGRSCQALENGQQPPFPAILTLVTQQGPPGTPGRLSITFNEQVQRVTDKTLKKKKKKKQQQQGEPQPGCSTNLDPVPAETACKQQSTKKKITNQNKKKACSTNAPETNQPPPTLVINVGPPPPTLPPHQKQQNQKKKATRKGKAVFTASSSSASTITIAPQRQPAVRIRLRVPQQEVVEVEENGNVCENVTQKKKQPRKKRSREEYPEDRCESPQPGPSRRCRVPEPDPEPDTQRCRGAHNRKMRPDLGDDDRPFPCRICGERFVRQCNLDEHIIRIHENRRRHRCGVCGMRFNMPQDLRKHMETHNDNRTRYPCSSLNCPKSFAKKSGVRRHLMDSCKYKDQPPQQVPPEEDHPEDEGQQDDDDDMDQVEE